MKGEYVMILADKIMTLRKQNGWSQEDLAEKLDVSRQSVSKWESAQSVPDLDKIMKLSELFGVPTDYLLKDSVEETEMISDSYQPSGGRRIDMEEANDFIIKSKKTSVMNAIGTFLCIMSPTVLIFLAAISEAGYISEDLGAGIGIVTLLLLIAIAVVIFIVAGAIMKPYEFLEKEDFSISYGVEGMADDRMKKGQKAYTIWLCVGVVLCILCSLPLIISAFLTENGIVLCGMVDLLLSMVAIAVFIFIVNAGEREACEKLLQTEEFTQKNKHMNKKVETIGSVYWGLATAIYLAWSFVTMQWTMTWIVWPVAGVLFAVVMAIAKLVIGTKDE